MKICEHKDIDIEDCYCRDCGEPLTNIVWALVEENRRLLALLSQAQHHAQTENDDTLNVLINGELSSGCER